MWLVDAIAKAVKGSLHRVEKGAFSAISTDSRTIREGEFFVPLKGPFFDGHLFVEAAYARSGGGSLCDRERPEIFERAQGTLVLVDDTNQALLDLASFKRGETAGEFVAITGSNGKTTTKELLVHMVGDLFPLAFNEKNYNNQVGVAKTLLAMEESPRYGVFELGTNHKGEIEVLSRMVRPHMSLITNINPSHLEGLSDLEGVRQEKLSLFETTLPGGRIFVNADDPSLASYRPKEGLSISTFGVRSEADFMLRVMEERGIEGFDVRLFFPGTEVRTTVRLLGRHNLSNVLAASALAHSMGVPIARLAEAIPEFQPYKGRFRPVESRKGFVIIDDAYNANPASMQWAIETLSTLPCTGKRIAVLGEMRELGEKKDGYHRELGRMLKASALSLILLLGEETKITFHEIGNGRARHFEDKARLMDFLSGKVGKGDIVLVKGSRALGMDEIVEALV